MAARDRVSIAIESGSFDSVVLRREGLTVAVLTGDRPPPPPAQPEPWVPPPLPPPARALRVALVDGLLNEVVGTSVDDLITIESASLDVPLAARATPETPSSSPSTAPTSSISMTRTSAGSSERRTRSV